MGLFEQGFLDKGYVQEKDRKVYSFKENEQLKEFLKDIQNKSPGASNNWVIHGNHTVSGKPIFGNDPHLEPMIPTHFHLAEVRVGSEFIIGAAIPGTLYFASARNEHMAWGITSSNLDKSDIFEELINKKGT